MNARCLLVAVAVSFLAVHRLPAPIVEQTPAPQSKPKEKAKSQTSEANHSQSRGFDGKWVGSATVTSNDAAKSNMSESVTMIITGHHASSLQEVTNTMGPQQQAWNNLPEPWNTTRSILLRWKYDSNDLTVDGSNLRIRWPAGKLVEWSPKGIPSTALEAAARDNPRTSVYTLKGDQLTREFDSNGGVTYHRVK